MIRLHPRVLDPQIRNHIEGRYPGMNFLLSLLLTGKLPELNVIVESSMTVTIAEC